MSCYPYWPADGSAIANLKQPNRFLSERFADVFRPGNGLTFIQLFSGLTDHLTHFKPQATFAHTEL